MNKAVPGIIQARTNTYAKRASATAPPSEKSTIGVRDMLAMAATVGSVEVYIDWSQDPVGVVSRAGRANGHTWTTVSVMLHERVARAIQPLIDAGWRLDGSSVSAMRWDTSFGKSGQEYEGCWVRMLSRDA